MSVSLKVCAATIAVLAVAATTSAQGRRPFEVPPGRTASQPGGTLTPPSNASPAAVLAQYLRGQGRDEVTVRSLVQAARSDARNGISQARFEQRAAGLPVYGTYAKAAFNDRGELVFLVENLVAVPGAVARANVDAQQAVGAAIRYLYPDLAGVPAGFFRNAPSAKDVAIPEADGSMSAGYLVETWTQQANQLHYTLIGGDGAVLDDEARTSSDSYRVFTVNPGVTPQATVLGPGAGNAQSPSGWVSPTDQLSTRISGNNAFAYLDTDANNGPDTVAGSTLISDGNFVTAANLSSSPSTLGNKEVAVQNLFYLNNLIHDELYTHGFTEAAGNFQKSNFANGGLGNDPVNAEAQDGSGTDNANFATPSDGSSPRMQMYLWTGTGTHQVVVGGTTFAAAGAQFGAALTTTGKTGPLALVNDGAAPTTDACTALPAGSMTGKIALIDRGTCDFITKVKNAQSAGAIAAIIANNAGDSIFTMGGTSRTITIPSVMVGQTDGGTLKTKVGQSTIVRKSATAPLQRDGDVDSDVVFHEYCHGLTWRMIGRMDGPIAGAIGEGMSDTCALLMGELLQHPDDRIGEYSASDSAGIRRYPYTNYPLTYANMNSGEVHNDGELYGAIGWMLMSDPNLFGGPRVPLLFGYLVDGMNYTPERPTYEQMRDGILQAVTDGADECRVWTAFAHYGVGVGAKATIKGTKVTITQSFALPAQCQ
jgi:hypothetical protein